MEEKNTNTMNEMERIMALLKSQGIENVEELTNRLKKQKATREPKEVVKAKPEDFIGFLRTQEAFSNGEKMNLDDWRLDTNAENNQYYKKAITASKHAPFTCEVHAIEADKENTKSGKVNAGLVIVHEENGNSAWLFNVCTAWKPAYVPSWIPELVKPEPEPEPETPDPEPEPEKEAPKEKGKKKK